MALLVTAGMAGLNWAATVIFALSENAELALITGVFGFLSSTVAALFGYLAHRTHKRVETKVGKVETKVEEVEAKVDAPRKISTTREEGVRVEGPEV